MLHRFGQFEFDASTGELRKQGRLVRIEPQPARALALLVARAGEVISKEEMRAHVWGESTHVDFDRGLAYCIGQVRAALGDVADNPRFVETLPKRGYRFIAPVAPPQAVLLPEEPLVLSAPPADRTARPPSHGAARAAGRIWWTHAALTAMVVAAVGWTVWAGRTAPRPIIAVAIFDNETGNTGFDRLAATTADIVVERLTALGPLALGVIGNTPTLRVPRERRDPAAVQRETGADYFVFGQVQNDDAGVRLVVHLIRLDDDTHLWVTRVARPPSMLADVQDVVADRLAEAVRRHVIERDPNAPRFTR